MSETVNVDNFKRAESDNYFSKFAPHGALGQFTPAVSPRTGIARRSTRLGTP